MHNPANSHFRLHHVAAILLPLAIVGCSTLPEGIDIGADSPSGKYVFGASETVFMLKQKIAFEARMDTGATTCSMSAQNIQQFERDGKKWVRFTVTDPKTGKVHKQEARITRIASIKQHGRPDVKRPVVKLPIKAGNVERLAEFSLTDRSHFEFPVLIGRNLMEGSMVIDVEMINSGGTPFKE